MSIYNAVQCNYCKSVIESVHRHDFKTCDCGHVSVDGGKDYKKRLWRGDPQNWVELDSPPSTDN